MNKANNFQQLRSMIASDSTVLQKMKNDPLQTLDEITNPIQNPKIFKLVLFFVGGALIICLIVAAIISFAQPIELIDESGNKYTQVREIDQFFVMIGSAAVGALAGLLVPTPDNS